MKKSLLILSMILTGLVFIAASGQEIKPTDIKNLDLNRTTQETPPAGVLKPDLDFGKFPLYFITNKGQKNKKAVFYAKASRYTLWMTKEGLVFDSVRDTEPRIDRERRLMDPMARREDFRQRKFERSVSRLFFLNSNPDPEMIPVQETEHRVNYFIGNDRSKWHCDIPTSQAVLYKELYTNIDCKVYGIERQVEYDWIVKQGGNPDDIRFEYREVKGTRIDEEGNLLIATEFGELMHKKPYSYQEINETERVEIDVTFKKIGENIYGFEVGDYDRSCELIIDPVVLAYSTYLGGRLDDVADGIALDNNGYVYVTGNISSADFPIKNSYKAYDGSSEIFVAKLDTTSSGASSLICSTIVGGSFIETGGGIAVDNSGYVYVIGETISTDFPIVNGYQTFSGGYFLFDIVLIKLDMTQSGVSSLVYSTCLGGDNDDWGNGIAVNNSGCAYIIGNTESTNFPILNEYQADPGDGNRDAFVSKIDTTRSGVSSLIYSTYLGGNGEDAGEAIAVGGSGYAYVTGYTASTDYPCFNELKPYNGYIDGFITKIDTSQSGTSSLMYSTYFGGTDRELGFGIALDVNEIVYVTGVTGSTDFPSLNPYQSQYKGNGDAFVIKIDTTKNGNGSLIYSTYIGGSRAETGRGIVIGNDGYVYLAGETYSLDYPTLNPYQTDTGDGKTDGFVTKLDVNQSGASCLIYSTYIGGGDYDYIKGIAVDNNGNAFITGEVYSTDFPTINQYQTYTGDGRLDAFLSKLVFASLPVVSTTSATAITATSAAGGGNVTSDGGALTTRGVCWSTSSNPTVSDSHTTDGTGTGSFTSSITGLTPGTTYYVRAYATNSLGTAYGNEVSFTTSFPSAAISGTVTDGINPIASVIITFSHDGHTETTDSNGQYAYTVPYNTTTTITPGHTGYGNWTPASITLNNIITNQVGQDFQATINTYSISGIATDGTNPIPGVTITFSHDGHVETTDANGNYSYTVTYGTSTTLTPNKAGYGPWSPASRTYTNISADQIQDFTSGLTSFIISGTVTDKSNPLTGVTITFSHNGHTETTDANGNYSYTVTYGTSTTVTASKSGYTFTPSKYTLDNISENKTGCDFSTPQDSIVTVSITSPKGGASVSGNVSVSADVSSTKTISKVVFYIDGTQVNQDTTSPYQYTWDSSTVSNGSHTIKARAYDSDGKTGEHTITVFVHNSSGSETPSIVLSRTRLNYGAEHTGTSTGFQSFFINNSGDGTLNWTATPSDSWILVDPGSGTGPGEVSVWIDTAWMSPGTYTGTISIADPNASNSPQTAAVTLIIHKHKSTSGPFGQFSTPIDGSTVSSSIPVTGWVLDDIEVESVKIYRDNNVYVGDALFVEGARPDIESAYPTYPFDYRSGWGYMLLTNFLPNGGNGTYTLHAVAVDKEGKTVDLGSKTIICDNANAVKPFGAIDTPLQGGDASGGSYRNNGWVLTPMPNKIPTDGSTIFVYVDGVRLGNVRYNIYREDIAGFFPGYANSGGAAGYFDLDTTAYADGVHTISWSAVDNAGNTDGIGSRYFSVQNSISQSAARRGDLSWLAGSDGTPNISDIPVDYSAPVFVKQGYHGYVEPMETYPDNSGIITVSIRELERIEIWVGAGNAPEVLYTGYQIAGERFLPLPVGSTLDEERGIFYWQPGPGFVGEYRFVFIEKYINGDFSRKYINILIR